MEILYGKSAVSDFRREELIKKVSERLDEKITDIQVNYMYLIDDDNKKGLDVFGFDFTPSMIRMDFFIMPRTGTITPWSSKATEILHKCGFTHIRRIEIGKIVYLSKHMSNKDLLKIVDIFYDKMTEEIHFRIIPSPFKNLPPEPIKFLEWHNLPSDIGINKEEISWLQHQYFKMNMNPTDAELYMYAQINSEHCRHKIFNGIWTIDEVKHNKTLFDKIKETYDEKDKSVISAYTDNSAVIRGFSGNKFRINPYTKKYVTSLEPINLLMKVETHNHPTGISPFPGAATGSGGEIRDEAATGQGAQPKAGLTGFSVSNLKIKDFKHLWEIDNGNPENMATPLVIMLEAPIGAARFNNEFGRPVISGYFRTFEMTAKGITYGYHKPIMLAGGMGNIRQEHAIKPTFVEETLKVVVIGGPAMLIGLGGATGSSANTGTNNAALDFASVQRGNPEMQRRSQEVINTCWSMGEHNPIVSIHDLGAGGLSNGVPEIIHSLNKEGYIDLREIPNAHYSMSPMELWCNESQERYVLLLSENDVEPFLRLCQRENCPCAVIGNASESYEPKMLSVEDTHFDNFPIDIPMSFLFPESKQLEINVHRKEHTSLQAHIGTHDSALSVGLMILRHPTVASKNFLITIGDRTVTGLVSRDQMVGKWQVPVSNVAVTLLTYDSIHGEAMTVGERTPLAVLDAPASGRMAVGEALTNIATVYIGNTYDIKISANWMASTKDDEEKINLYNTVTEVTEFCKDLGITIPVGKDSLFMKAQWDGKEIRAPLSLIISAFAPVADVRKTVTPELQWEPLSELILIDLGEGKNRMGGSIYQQIHNRIGGKVPDIESNKLESFFMAIQFLIQKELIIAYHDRSDGGLFTTLCEMCFAGRMGITVDLNKLIGEVEHILFNEELGAVIQVVDTERVLNILNDYGLHAHTIGKLNDSEQLIIRKGKHLIKTEVNKLQYTWQENSYQIQKLRDNPKCAKEELENVTLKDSGLFSDNFSLLFPVVKKQHKIAILREQGINGHIEMANAFHTAGFQAVDVHMNDILTGRVSLNDFRGIAACGGFSYGDTLGAGTGWAKSILLNETLKNEFSHFFNRADTFGLGVCNGCQMFAQLRDIIPGTEMWTDFLPNTSEQFESRMVMVQIRASNSIFFSKDMWEKRFPIVVAHGEGRLMNTFGSKSGSLYVMQYVDHNGEVTERYPYNPNGSLRGVTGLTNSDGRFTIMMPHPERLIRTTQYSWHPDTWGVFGPWMKMFINAFNWCNDK